MNYPKYVKVGDEFIRIPLDHPKAEQLSARINKLINCRLLSKIVRGDLVKKAWWLRRADRTLSRMLGDRDLPPWSFRPKIPEGSLGDIVGWVLGVEELVIELERQVAPVFVNEDMI